MSFNIELGGGGFQNNWSKYVTGGDDVGDGDDGGGYGDDGDGDGGYGDDDGGYGDDGQTLIYL